MYYVYAVYAVMVICNKHLDFDRSPTVRSGKDSVNVWNSYHRTECSKFWVRIPVEPVISFIWKVKMKVGRTRHDSFLCMCITYVKQCKSVSWKIKSCLYMGEGAPFKDYMCKRALKINPKQEFTNTHSLQSFYFHKYIFFFCSFA